MGYKSSALTQNMVDTSAKLYWQEYYFKKNCNHVAKALLFNLLLQSVLAWIAQMISMIRLVYPILMPWMSQNPGASLPEIMRQAAMVLSQNQKAMELSFFWIGIIMLICNTIPFLICAKKTGVRIGGLFRGMPIKFKTVLLGFVVVLGVNFVGGLLYQLIDALFGLMHIKTLGDSLAFPVGGSAIDVIGYLAFCCIIAPITEEFIFRGVLLKSLSRYGTRFALIITSILFGVIHGNLQQILPAFLIGLVFGYIAIKSGSIKLTILLHFMNNAFVTAQEVFLAYGGEAATIITGVFNMVLIIGCIIGTIIILICNRKKLCLISDDPVSARNDNIISIAHPYRKFFARLFVILLLILVALLILSTIQIV